MGKHGKGKKHKHKGNGAERRGAKLRMNKGIRALPRLQDENDFIAPEARRGQQGNEWITGRHGGGD